ncbi:hypothetical protein N8590_01310 [bacterium]|jgi:hypothetical protein|nr:hypothetical protein [Planctomicrobium sp.]MDA7527604.1 hypothetical protein [bacterium]
MNSLPPSLFFLILTLTIYQGVSQQSWGQSTIETQLEFSEGVIVLDDGRVFSGKISNVAGGYRIDWSGTYAIVPFGKVDVTSPSLNGAYIALRDRTLKPTAADHLQLAEWCLTNDLVGQARSEVTKALTLEPLRPESRVMMSQIDQRLNPEKQKIKIPNQAAMTIDGFLRAKENRSGGMVRETHQDFIRQVQPLLMNKCGNAYCHGQAAKNAFHLEPIQRGTSGNRLQSQQNMEAVLKFIDKGNPSRSKLLLTDPSIDAIHRKVFLGSRGALQYKILTDWVVDVAGKPLQETPLSTSPVTTQIQTIQLTGAEMINSPQVQVEPTPEQQAAILTENREQTRRDPFDPDVFNRRVHGLTARELKEGETLDEKK